MTSVAFRIAACYPTVISALTRRGSEFVQKYYEIMTLRN